MTRSDGVLWATAETLANGPSDYAFSGDGIVFADGTEKPAMQEVRYWYADASTRAAHDAACDAAEAESARADCRAGSGHDASVPQRHPTL